MTPYREYVLPLNPEKSMNVYKYVVVDTWICSICSKDVAEQLAYLGAGQWSYRGKRRSCHPFKRLVVSGSLWWKKKCPIAGIHYHVRCNVCDYPWIRQINDQSEMVEVPYEHT